MTKPQLYYEAYGRSGPYLLLVHGLLSSRGQWLANLETLAEVCRPVVVELFGHGRSPSPEDPSAYSPDAYAREFELIREALKAERWYVCGQSLGAALTLRYVLDHPDRVKAHVFTNSISALADDAWRNGVRPLMEAQAKLLEEQGRAALESHPLNPSGSRRLPANVREALAADMALHDPRGVALTGVRTVPESSQRERVGENRVPSLLIVGEREDRFSEHRRFAEENMPLLRTIGLNAGHAVNAEAADEFNRELMEFLREHGCESIAP